MIDDDLPVLTHVLRTRDDHHPHALIAPLEDFQSQPPFARQIVIGNDAHTLLDHGDEQTVHVGDGGGSASPHDIVADPRRTFTSDAFSLAQDLDATEHGPAPRIDMPALVASEGAVAADVPGHDTELDFSTPAVAEQVRRAVFDDLSARIDTELDARIAQAMRDEVETALAQLQDRLRVRISEALRDVVARAVDEEIARMSWSAASHDRPH